MLQVPRRQLNLAAGSPTAWDAENNGFQAVQRPIGGPTAWEPDLGDWNGQRTLRVLRPRSAELGQTVLVADQITFPLRTEKITLGNLLKAAGIVGSGAEAKLLLRQGQVTVNGEEDSRRGRQLSDGDVVVLADGTCITLTAGQD